MFTPGFQELIVIGVIAVLLFGKRLPEVAKSLGKSYNEFRKSLSDIQSSIDYDTYTSPNSSSSYSSSSSTDDSQDEYDDYDEPTAPKFEPPPSEPQTAADESRPSDDIPKPVSEK
ncbi:MAG: twin-arginine translocase TatA/TatE family subunit [Pirellulaceae bacterium]